MRIRIIGEGDEYALTDLRSWLDRDPGTAGLSVESVAGDGPTMGVLEALDIILGNGTDLANFAVAYATWRATRANGAGGGGAGDGGRTLTHGGSTVDISHLSPEELADLLRRLDGGDQGDGTPE
ncbi:effector-associated constant component EACC1 [Streptomyces sp. CA-135486]|uniref:effector-associated constant component EACC1 n=1 Tax=Streptomyces sp. CA-135486 TaxID=3240049 RepID=UPI003D8AE868